MSDTETTEKTLDSHISFMYSVAQVHATIPAGRADTTPKTSIDEARDDIEFCSSTSFESDAGVTELRDQYIYKDKSRLRKPASIPFMNNIGKALKKSWRRPRKASDKVPLISRRNMVDWDVTPTYEYTRNRIVHDTTANTGRTLDF